MYLDFWKMNLLPFENVPSPRFFYPSYMHEEALQRMIYTIDQGKGAAMIVGDVGCGKTLIGNTLARKLTDRKYHVVSMTNPSLSATAFLQMVSFLFGVPERTSSSKPKLWRGIEKKLRHNNHGNRSVLIIDEAQCISDKRTLEELRMLLNLQADDRFLINVILLGQNEMETSIRRMNPLNQRIAIKYRLLALPPEDTAQYIRHRLEVAGCPEIPFGDEAIARIFEYSGGIPRIINNLCDRSLLAAFLQKTKDITGPIVEQAWADFDY